MTANRQRVTFEDVEVGQDLQNVLLAFDRDLASLVADHTAATEIETTK